MVACIPQALSWPPLLILPSSPTCGFQSPILGLPLLYTSVHSLGAPSFYLYAEISQMYLSSPDKSFQSTRPTDSSVSLISPLESPPDLKISMPKTDLGSPPPSTYFYSPDSILNKPHCSAPNPSNQMLSYYRYFIFLIFLNRSLWQEDSPHRGPYPDLWNLWLCYLTWLKGFCTQH